MSELTIDNLIPGEYYHIQEKKIGELVFKYKYNNGDKDRPVAHYYVANMNSGSFASSAESYTGTEDVTPFITNRNCRRADLDEIMWLEGSRLKNQYMPKEEAIQYYKEFYKRGDEWINKKQEDLEKSDFYDGQEFQGIINDIYCEGKVSISLRDNSTYEPPLIFLCQNKVLGTTCLDKKGFDYSYIIGNPYLALDGTNPGIQVKDLRIKRKDWNIIPNSGIILEGQKSFISFSNKDFLNVTGLEDNADERLMMSNTEDLSFVGFSKIDETPIFMIKNSDISWRDSFLEKIKELNGNINLISIEDINKHLELTEL